MMLRVFWIEMLLMVDCNFDLQILYNKMEVTYLYGIYYQIHI